MADIRIRVRIRGGYAVGPDIDTKGVTAVLFEDSDPIDAGENDILIDENDTTPEERTAINTLIAAHT